MLHSSNIPPVLSLWVIIIMGLRWCQSTPDHVLRNLQAYIIIPLSNGCLKATHSIYSLSLSLCFCLLFHPLLVSVLTLSLQHTPQLHWHNMREHLNLLTGMSAGPSASSLTRNLLLANAHSSFHSFLPCHCRESALFDSELFVCTTSGKNNRWKSGEKPSKFTPTSLVWRLLLWPPRL